MASGQAKIFRTRHHRIFAVQTVTVVYRSPRSCKNTVSINVYFDEISDLLASLFIKHGYLLITDDFNIHVDTIEISNDELWQRTRQLPPAMEVRKRKWDWIGHILRKEEQNSTRHALRWNPPGKRRRGRPRNTWRRSWEAEMKEAGLDWHSMVRMSICVAQCPRQLWFTNDKAKQICRQLERRWRTTKLEDDRCIFNEARNNVTNLKCREKTSISGLELSNFRGTAILASRLLPKICLCSLFDSHLNII